MSLPVPSKSVETGPLTPEIQGSSLSMLSIFRALRNLEDRANTSILMGRINADDWKRVLSHVKDVTVLKLAGEPLFPSVREFHVEDLDLIVDYLSIFISPSIELVHISPPKSASPNKSPASTPELGRCSIALEAFLVYLCDATPRLHTLRIGNAPKLSALCLENIIRLSNLRTLELRRVANVKDFLCLRSLGSLSTLERLELELQVSCNRTACQFGTMPMGNFLPNLTELDLVGPSGIVFDFIRALGSSSLVKLTLRCTTSGDTISYKPSQDQIPTQVFALLGDRWQESLQELRVNTSTDGECDLQLISKLGALRHLHIRGSSINSLVQSLAVSTTTPSSGCWFLLETLTLPDNYTICLQQLRSIAEAAPSLQVATLQLDYLHIPSFYATKPVQHPLKTLNLSGDCSPDHSKRDRKGSQDELQLSHLQTSVDISTSSSLHFSCSTLLRGIAVGTVYGVL